MSPTLYLPVTSASMSSRPITRASRPAISRTVTLSPLPTFKARPAAEDRQHPGVWIRERLVGSVDVEEAQSRRRHVVGGPEEQAHALLVVLVERVDRGEGGPLALRRRFRPQRFAV